MEKRHFNSYKEELDLDFLKQYCLDHGEVKTFEQGEALEKAGEASRWIAYVESGYFKYMAHNALGGVKAPARASPSRASSLPTIPSAWTANCRS